MLPLHIRIAVILFAVVLTQYSCTPTFESEEDRLFPDVCTPREIPSESEEGWHYEYTFDTVQDQTDIKSLTAPDTVSLQQAIDCAIRKLDSIGVGNPILVSEICDRGYDTIRANLDLIVGDLFDNGRAYAMIRRGWSLTTLVDVVEVTNGQAIPLIQIRHDHNSYIKDTIFDVNGDGYRDFVIHWYPSSGCCLADVYNVYLYQPDTLKFSADYEFVNPTFYPKEQIIRGVAYGHSGTVPLYKYQWRGAEVDTIEYIYPDQDTAGQYIRTPRRVAYPSADDGVVLHDVPVEYRSMEAYYWFQEE